MSQGKTLILTVSPGDPLTLEVTRHTIVTSATLANPVRVENDRTSLMLASADGKTAGVLASFYKNRAESASLGFDLFEGESWTLWVDGKNDVNVFGSAPKINIPDTTKEDEQEVGNGEGNEESKGGKGKESKEKEFGKGKGKGKDKATTTTSTSTGPSTTRRATRSRPQDSGISASISTSEPEPPKDTDQVAAGNPSASTRKRKMGADEKEKRVEEVKKAKRPTGGKTVKID
ncbi:hypothetical protein BJ165DRAFT_1406984 [Panaeolus papilionaceus]|nr:hypothetical protein BJ165DRAFT_1406984 [Panaeolus papilionaceus]